MRVKVGDTWYEATPGQPIGVELTEADKSNIANMAPEATMYAEFIDDSRQPREVRLAWMEKR